MRPVLNLPDTLAADKALAAVRDHRAHAAMLVDATGAAVGLLTIQDLLGELLAMGQGAANRVDAGREASR